jgi:hypothetical protein
MEDAVGKERMVGKTSMIRSVRFFDGRTRAVHRCPLPRQDLYEPNLHVDTPSG